MQKSGHRFSAKMPLQAMNYGGGPMCNIGISL